MLSDAATSVCSGSLSTLSDQDQPSNFLSVISPKDKPWDIHKLQAVQVSEALALGLPHHQKQADRMRQCAQGLEFGWSLLSPETGEMGLRLKSVKFCRVRHCPVCQWRRSLMWVARFYQAFPRIFQDHPEMRYIFLTLTVRNCGIQELRQTITAMNAGFQRLVQRKTWPALGYARSLEITRSKDGQAHPHFHCLLAVPPGYFVGRKYLSQRKWALLWQNALRVDYSPVCDVRIVKPKPLPQYMSEGLPDPDMAALRSGIQEGNLNHAANVIEQAEALKAAIAETIKYSVKPEDMLADAEWLREMADQLRNCRQIALGGIFKQYLTEEEPEDLVSEDSAAIEENTGGVFFGWRERYARYAREKNS